MFKRAYEKADGPCLYLYDTKAHVLKPLEERGSAGGKAAPSLAPRQGEKGNLRRPPEKRTFLAPKGYCSLRPSRSEPSSQRSPFPSPGSPRSDWDQSLDTSGKDGVIWQSLRWW